MCSTCMYDAECLSKFTLLKAEKFTSKMTQNFK